MGEETESVGGSAAIERDHALSVSGVIGENRVSGCCSAAMEQDRVPALWVGDGERCSPVHLFL